MDRLGDAIHHAKLPDVAQMLGKFGRKTDNLILADRNNLDGVRVLVVEDVTLGVM